MVACLDKNILSPIDFLIIPVRRSLSETLGLDPSTGMLSSHVPYSYGPTYGKQTDAVTWTSDEETEPDYRPQDSEPPRHNEHGRHPVPGSRG